MQSAHPDRAKRNGREVDESEGEPVDARMFALVGENRPDKAAMRWLGTLDLHLTSLRKATVDNGDHGDLNFPTLLGAVEMAAAKAKSRVEDWISRQGANGEDPGVGI